MHIKIQNPNVEHVDKYKYLGICWNEQWGYSFGIKTRTEMACGTFLKMKKEICRAGGGLEIGLEMCIVHCMYSQLHCMKSQTSTPAAIKDM